ncbi:DUF6289 family protein [Nannocystis pusilla]|uniref:DUF6289 family protein n=1 Tax=Nannocystis pusilla TaxID=889268 RepID=UPI003DA57178
MNKVGRTVLFLALFAVGALYGASSVDAASNCTYYSDASRTTVVGQYGYDCCNNKIAWGTKTFVLGMRRLLHLLSAVAEVGSTGRGPCPAAELRG